MNYYNTKSLVTTAPGQNLEHFTPESPPDATANHSPLPAPKSNPYPDFYSNHFLCFLLV